jgi:exopolysaccharide biosynthesis polyprenyl glycosylphosphotransferase
MSLAQRLAWFEGLSTLGIVTAILAMSRPAGQDPAAVWDIVPRASLVVLVCSTAFYFNDLYEFDTQRVLVLGGGSLAAELGRHIRKRSDLALTCVGFLGEGETGSIAGPRLGTYRDVAQVVGQCRPDRIIVAMPDRRGHLPVADLLVCRFRGILIEEGTQTFERWTRRLAVESLSPSALIFGDGFSVSRTYVFLKRLMSVGIAIIALVVAAPFLTLFALLIKLETPGPVFFIQERVGLGGRIFRLVKFRTMKVRSETDEVRSEADGVRSEANGVRSEANEEIWRRDNQSRVTRIGAILRKYRLDETPQFINILRGDMSLVGPRPEMAGNVATFSTVIPYYNLRHEVRPGLTGWAQVKAGYSMSVEEVTQKLCYDLYYVKHMSLRFDLRILFDTVKFVLCGKRPG